MILVDSCVLLDIFTEDPKWYSWSAETMLRLGEAEEMAINPIIYGEVSVGFSRIETLEEKLPATIFKRLQIPWEACFLAGKAFYQYRKKSGQKNSPLPDFYIGAHALVSGMRLITRDTKRFASYFPKLQLVTP